MSEFSELIQAIRDECGNEIAKRLDLKMRQMFGTRRIYIPGKPSPEVTQADTVETLKKRHGVSRATAYNWLNKYRL